MIKRLYSLFHLAWGFNDHLNRRSTVETYLWSVYQGKKPLPDREKCKELAIKLGVPSHPERKEKKNGG